VRLSKQWLQVPLICVCFVLVNPVLLFDLSKGELFVQLLGRRDLPSRRLLSLLRREQVELHLSAKTISKHGNVYVILCPLKSPSLRIRTLQRTRLLPSYKQILFIF
jgi:hypothetical protein